VYLLDDPLSSVDASVARHLQDRVIRGLLKSKCVLLVTHLTQYCDEADEVILLDKGSIRARGSYAQLSADLQKTVTTDNVDDILEGKSDERKMRPGSCAEAEVEIEKKAETNIGLIFTWKYLTFRNSLLSVSLLLSLSGINQVLLSGSDVFLKLWQASLLGTQLIVFLRLI